MIKVNYKIWLETEDGLGILGDGKWQLLKAINETGSLKLAMEKLNLSYRKTWNNIKKMETLLGFSVIETVRGGVDGGSACLSEKGKKIVETFDKFHSNFDVIFQDACNNFSKEIAKLK